MQIKSRIIMLNEEKLNCVGHKKTVVQKWSYRIWGARRISAMKEMMSVGSAREGQAEPSLLARE